MDGLKSVRRIQSTPSISYKFPATKTTHPYKYSHQSAMNGVTRSAMASGAGSRAKKKAAPSRRPRVWSSIGFLRRGTRPDLMGFLHLRQLLWRWVKARPGR